MTARKTVFLALVLLLAVVMVTVHLAPVQRAAFRWAVDRGVGGSGWWVEARDVRFRLFPGRLELSELKTGQEAGRPVAAARRIEARWSWWRLIRRRRIDSLRIERLALDGTAYSPPEKNTTGAAAAPVLPVEIGTLTATGAGAWPAGAALLRVHGVRLEGHGDGRVTLRAAGVLEVELGEIRLLAGRIEAASTLEGLRPVALEARFAGDVAHLEARLVQTAPPTFEFSGELDAAAVRGRAAALGLSSAPAATGHPQLAARLVLTANGPEVSAVLENGGFAVEGVPIARVSGRTTAGPATWRVRAEGPWGEVRAERQTTGEVVATAQLRRFTPPHPLAARLVHRFPPPVRLSGTAEVRLPPGWRPAVGWPRMRARWDLAAVLGGLRVSTSGSMADGGLTVERAVLAAAGGAVRVSGQVLPVLGLEATGRIPDLAAYLDGVASALTLPEPARALGGSVRFAARLTGDPARPRLAFEGRGRTVSWERWCLDTVELTAEGDLRRAHVMLGAARAGATLAADGTVSLGGFTAHATARLVIPAADATLAALGLPRIASGRAEANLEGSWSRESWSVTLATDWRDAAVNEARLGTVHLEAEVDPRGVRITRLTAQNGAGTIAATGGLAGWEPAAPLLVRVAIDGWPLPPPAGGRLHAHLVLGGTASKPQGRGTASWRPARPGPLMGAEASFSLEGDVLTAAPLAVRTAAGDLTASVRLPLGRLPRPGWLWPGASGGPITLRAQGCALRLAPLLALLGREAPVDAGADVTLDLELASFDRAGLRGLLRFEGLELEAPMLALRAEGPLEIGIERGKAWLAPTRLTGSGTELALSASCDLMQLWTRGRVHGTLGPALLQTLLPTAQVTGELAVDARWEGPLWELAGGARFEHRGTLRLQDPPMEIGNVWAELSLGKWGLSIEDGGATVNGGRVLLGGGWDPESGQGVVADLEGVSLLLGPGVLTRWSGPLALEPRRRGMALVADLELERGIWDGPFDLAAATAPAPPPPAAGGLLDRIALEIEVGEGPGIWVDNNLGQFRVVWRDLEVSGTLARPLPTGELRVLPGGKLAVGGRSLTIVRGSVVLPDRPGAEPDIEIVARDRTAAGGLRQLGLTEILQAGASTALGRLLGAEPATAPPAEVAAQTETVQATRLTLGQRFGRHVTLYVSTDLGSSGDRLTLLQLGGFRHLSGLYAQAFDSSREPSGWALLKRWRWGGARLEAARGQRLAEVKFAGRWPVSRRLLKWSTGIRAGQRWDPFLAFAAEVKLERELAARGWPDARVRAEVRESARGPRLVLRCEPGSRLEVRWQGDRVPRAVRRRILALYRRGALEEASLEAMRAALVRELAARGFPLARAEVRRAEGGLRIRVERGTKLELARLQLDGVPPETAAAVSSWMRSPADLAAVLHGDPGAMERLHGLLSSEGFPEAELGTPERVDTGRRRAVVRVVVRPGPRLLLGPVTLVGRDPLGRMRSRAFPLRKGAPLRRRLLDAARRFLLNAYRRAGFTDARVQIRIGPTRAGSAPVSVHLDPGVARTVGTIRWQGLRYLRPEVLDSGVELRPGQPLREAELDRSLARIAQFPPVESVRVEIPKGEPSADVVLHVSERPRWTLGAGLRWQGERGQQLLFEAADENLLGRGIAVRLRGRLGSKDRSAFAWLDVPALPGGTRSWALVGSFQRTERGDVRDRTAALIGETRWRDGEGKELRLYLEESWARTTAIAGGDLVEESHRAAVGAQAVWDRRSSPLDPESGFLASLDLSAAPAFLGADPSTLRAVVRLAWAKSPSERLTFAQSFQLGAARALEGQLARGDRLFAGGETSVRGFDQDSLGPVTCDFVGCRPAGGGALVAVQQEIRWRLRGSLGLAAFLDAGQVWPSWSDVDARLALGAGIGLRLATPVGPLRLDLAWPIAHKRESSGLHVYLGVGQLF